MDIRENRLTYRELCRNESLPLFSQAWWLDAVAGERGWTAVIASRGSHVVGALPYVLARRWGMTLVTQPKLTQSLGPWVGSAQAKYANVLAAEKEVLGALADALPGFDEYRQNWDPARANWLPFYWRGYEQTTRYTYILDNISDSESLWAGMQKDIRGNIRKATKRFGLRVRLTDDIGELLPILRKTFSRQGKALPVGEQFLRGVDRAAAAQGKRAIMVVEDSEGHVHAGTYVVWEGDTAYQILNAYDSEYRQTGAGSLSVWQAIQEASEYVSRYDFEGSMLEPVERFFRAFGATQVPYFRIKRTDSRVIRGARCLRNTVQNRRRC